jgi:hypothetical protein
LPQTQVTRLFDNVPLSARAQDLIGSRIIYGNYKQFFDLKKPSGEPIVPDFSLSLQSTAIEEGTPAETFKSGRDYEVGIAYLDQFGRMTTVLESGGNGTGIDATINIPISKAKDKNELKVNINSRAPEFASKYRLFLKQNRSTYYNMLPLAVFQEGLFVYFQLAKYDIDKVKAGDYIYIKATPSGISTTTEKYKVLEAEQKVKNFLGEQKEQEQEEGFYVKLKVENNLFDENSLTTYKDFPVSYNGYGGSKKSRGLNTFDSPLSASGYYTHVDTPIFYGKGSSNLYVVPRSVDYLFDTDRRLIVEVTGARTFSFRDYRLSYNYGTNITMNSETIPTPSGNTLGNALRVDIGGVSHVLGYIIFEVPGLSNYSIGDSWRVNYRGNKYSINGSPIYFENTYATDGPFVGTPNRGTDINNNEGDLPITPGSIIKFQINEGFDQPEQRFVASGSYDNIEEWFFEERIYEKFSQLMTDGRSDGSKTVFFRRGVVYRFYGDSFEIEHAGDPRGYIMMLIKGYSSSDGSDIRRAIYLNFSVVSPDNLTILETEGIPNNDAVYYELPGTYPIEVDFTEVNLLEIETKLLGSLLSLSCKILTQLHSAMEWSLQS